MNIESILFVVYVIGQIGSFVLMAQKLYPPGDPLRLWIPIMAALWPLWVIAMVVAFLVFLFTGEH